MSSNEDHIQMNIHSNNNVGSGGTVHHFQTFDPKLESERNSTIIEENSFNESFNTDTGLEDCGDLTEETIITENLKNTNISNGISNSSNNNNSNNNINTLNLLSQLDSEQTGKSNSGSNNSSSLTSKSSTSSSTITTTIIQFFSTTYTRLYKCT
ncbi:unnamed protein product [[Candida] boidinii]|nr:unnamed protein product [[Candida] boidinii]